MTDYSKSAMYRAGLFHYELGKLLMDPDTDVKRLADFGEKYGMDFDFKFTPQKPADQSNEAKK